MKTANGGLAAILAATLGQFPGLAAADDRPLEPEIHATAYHAIAPGTTLRMELADRSGLTDQAQTLLSAALPDAGYALDEKSPLVLTVATEMTETSGESRLPLELRATKGSLGMRLFLVGRNSSGVLQEDPQPSAGEYRIMLTIHDRRHPQGYLWRARATACRCGRSATTILQDMVPALVRTIGRDAGSLPTPRQ